MREKFPSEKLLLAAKAAGIKGDIVKGCFHRREFAVVDPRSWWKPHIDLSQAMHLGALLDIKIGPAPITGDTRIAWLQGGQLQIIDIETLEEVSLQPKLMDQRICEAIVHAAANLGEVML